MLHLAKKCLYTTLLTFSIFGMVCCNSSDDSSKETSDSSALILVDSTTVFIKQDSLKNFDNVIDSVYQHSPKKVFQALMMGYNRFSSDSSFVYNSEDKIPDSLSRIKPVLVVTDIDLSQSVEKIFDLRRSMFIQLSSPACLVDSKQMAVMEYAVNYSGTKLILILSSSGSRMIGAAVDNVQTPNFPGIINELNQATKTAPEFADRSSANKSFVDNIAQKQAQLTLEKILQASPQVKMMADSGRVILKSAFYDVSKKSVTILDREAVLNPSAKK